MTCKSPEAGTSWVCFINEKKARMAKLRQKWRGFTEEVGQIALGRMGFGRS